MTTIGPLDHSDRYRTRRSRREVELDQKHDEHFLLGSAAGLYKPSSPAKQTSVIRPPAWNSSVTTERHQESAAAEAKKPKAPVTYQVSEQPSTRVQEEEFA